MNPEKLNYLKAAFSLLLAFYGVHIARHPDTGGFLDNVDLVAHEAGHLFFSWFGQFIMVLGGSIGQLVPPLAFAVYFHIRRELFSFSVVLFWAGQNLVNISRYVKDAQSMDLSLVSVGGGDVLHDWNYLLLSVNLLRQDRIIGNIVLALGLVVMLASVVLGFYYSWNREEIEVSEGKPL